MDFNATCAHMKLYFEVTSALNGIINSLLYLQNFFSKMFLYPLSVLVPLARVRLKSSRQ